MNGSPLSETLIDYLVEPAEGFRFERLVQSLITLREGDLFVPLGGVHDGGADGFLRDIYEDKSDPGNFVQISKQADVRAKLRLTVDSLRKSGRNVHTINYWSSNRLPVDTLETELSKVHGLTIRIRDRNALLMLINHNATTRKHFLAAFRSEVFELSAQRHELAKERPDFVSDPSVYVFLQFQNAERNQKGGLVTPIVDALIYWALRDTDPDNGTLLSRDGIKERIRAVLPGAANTLIPSVDKRLAVLASKAGGVDQRVRAYKDADSFCLPYAIRVELAGKSANELSLQSEVRSSFASRAKDAGAENPDYVAEVCERAIYKHFNNQGLLLAAFLDKKFEGLTISDQIVEAELQAVAAKGKAPTQLAYNASLTVLRQVFYTPNAAEHEFLRRLNRTTMLLFSLMHCPRLVEYFNQMSSHFRLFIGTDILVKAVSESFLPPEHRHVTNLLKVAKSCGAQLILTAPVLKELFTSLHATYMEFKNNYAEREPYITASLAAQCDRIFIRTYFYAKLLMRQVKGWQGFINRFLDYDELARKSEKGESQLQAFFCKTYELDFMTEDDCKVGVSEKDLVSLTSLNFHAPESA